MANDSTNSHVPPSDPPPFIIYDDDDVIEGVKSCSKNLKLEEVDFLKALAKVQLWCLPPHFRIAKMGHKVGACLGKVVESDVFEERDRGTFIKVLVEIDTSKTLLPGIPVGSHKDGIAWVEFQYERLPQFCYRCGLIGHIEDMCKDPILESSDNSDGRKDFEPWMLASQFGRKVRVTQQHSSGPPREDRYQKTRGPLPCDVTDLLVALSVNNTSQSHQQKADSLPPIVPKSPPGFDSIINEEQMAASHSDTTPDSCNSSSIVIHIPATSEDKENHDLETAPSEEQENAFYPVGPHSEGNYKKKTRHR
ncbi:Zinc finger, CCHC-type [Sesbania bispinosa]|nr:Zinc finger, CCHC-type [Sesbania bispinosa]